jgi:hypothetical protein
MDSISNILINCNRYKVVTIITTFILSLSLLITVWTNSIDFSSYARCPNGYHKNPSGDCEKVVKSSTKLPRCPNGFHRSPDGDCKRVNESISDSSGNTKNSGSSSDFSNPATANINEASSNNNPDQSNIGIDNQNPVNPRNTFDNTITSSKNNNATTNIIPLINPSTNQQCDQSLWNHVYHPQRLQIIDGCKTVSGIIESKKSEPDGDYHIRLKVDPQFSNLINSANVNGQHGDMVVEPICQHTITESIAAALACSNFHQNINIPEVGSHVNITGSYVLDKEHNSWAEIHPITSITKIT